jgi:hypothetical protein
MLRSLNSLERYKVTATDGDVGAVSDFLLDDHANAPDASPGRATTWAVRYLIVQTGGFFHRRRVLVSPISIHEVDAATRRFHLSLTVEKIRNSPNFDADKPVSRAHEREHSQYYQYPYYWGYSGLWGMGAVPGVLATAGDEEDPLGDDRPRSQVRTRPSRRPRRTSGARASSSATMCKPKKAWRATSKIFWSTTRRTRCVTSS